MKKKIFYTHVPLLGTTEGFSPASALKMFTTTLKKPGIH